MNIYIVQVILEVVSVILLLTLFTAQFSGPHISISTGIAL